MAQNTSTALRNSVIYSIYVRNYSKAGTFKAVEQDLKRIKSIGVDIIWFMPIHPIGKISKKGSLGCPYSIQDYRTVNPDYGTMEDFQSLINTAHSLDLKVMIDVVFNHTSHDSILVKEHPDWFHQDENGKPITTVPEWSDIIDLKHGDPKLAEYLIDSLKIWSSMGVDGYRCDVASLLPLNFWVKARQEIAQINPYTIWLAESVHAAWVSFRRHNGLPTLSDAELFTAFDICYDYDIWAGFQSAIIDKNYHKNYFELLRMQDAIYPENYVKLRCVENHDQPRIMKMAPLKSQSLAWTAFQAFNKGAFLIYNGQEAAETKTPSLFDIDLITWGEYSLTEFLTKCATLKKHSAVKNGKFTIIKTEPCIQAVWENGSESLYGIFNTHIHVGPLKTILQTVDTTDIFGKNVSIKNGKIETPNDVTIFQTDLTKVSTRPFFSNLLDFNFEDM